jgi:hypothetical protein
MRAAVAALTLMVLCRAAAAGPGGCRDGLTGASGELRGQILRQATEALADDPNPIGRLESSGLLPSDPVAARTRAARLDFGKVRALAFAWRFGRDEAHLTAARDFVLAWASTHRSKGNPIDEAALPTLVQGYALIRDDLQPADRSEIDRWLASVFRQHYRRIRSYKGSTNWQSHRIHIAASIASALRDTKSLIELRRHFRAHAARNIRPDGSTFDFRLRDAIRYAVYTLQPQVETALLLEAAGLLAFDDRTDGTLARLRAGLDWLVPYAQGRRTHIEFETRQMPTDKKRAAAGVPGYSGKWNPDAARHLFWLAAYMDGTYLPIARALASEPPQHLVACRGEPVRR